MLAIAGLVVLQSALASAQPYIEVIVGDGGPMRGVATPDGRQFLGIPYAAPPVGALRWQPPAPPPDWEGVLDASQFGNNCPQRPGFFGTASTTEDCLYLNVYTPVVQTPVGQQAHPVMVWIHPGAFLVGESDMFDPTELTQQGVIVVTINYRLGVLGWLAHPALTAESGNGSSGNYGLMDQQAALRWVQRNINRFGGDPNNVTIFGESAGGVSVHAHMVSPLSAGLFDRAIIQSGAYTMVQPTVAQAEAQGTAYATQVGCTNQDAACLRALSVSQLLAAQSTSPTAYMPRVDGVVMPQSIRTAFTSGQFNRVPVIEGSTHDEFRLFIATSFPPAAITAANYPALIAAVLALPPAQAAVVVPLVMAQYPLADTQPATVAIALGAIGTDAIFACNSLLAASLLSTWVPTWGYEFNDPNAPIGALPPTFFPYGAFHGSELRYLFDVQPPAPVAFTPAQEQLSDAMQSYWTQFAQNGNPNSAATPAWPEYDPPVTNLFQRLAPPTPAPMSSIGFAIDHKCSFWASLAAASGS
jgi:para-nitrobenzyl esterase